MAMHIRTCDPSVVHARVLYIKAKFAAGHLTCVEYASAHRQLVSLLSTIMICWFFAETHRAPYFNHFGHSGG